MVRLGFRGQDGFTRTHTAHGSEGGVLGVEYVRVDHILESGHVRGLVYTPSSLPSTTLVSRYGVGDGVNNASD
jgi:hypothetical protein